MYTRRNLNLHFHQTLHDTYVRILLLTMRYNKLMMVDAKIDTKYFLVECIIVKDDFQKGFENKQ